MTTAPATAAPMNTADKATPATFIARVNRHSPHVAAVAVGSFFILSGYLKVFDPWSFYGSVLSYEIVGPPGARMAMLLLPIAEVVLGALAVTGLFRWAGLAGIISLLAFVFMPAVTYAWIAGTAENCGCLGELVKRSPGETLIEDVIIIGLAVYAIRGKPLLDALWTKKLLPLRTLAVIILAILAMGVSVNNGSFEEVRKGPLTEGRFLGDAGVSDAPNFSFLNGTYVMMLFSPSCPHCRQSVPYVNRLAEDASLPAVMALCPDTPQFDPREFVEALRPKFPVARLAKEDFGALTQRVPRFALVRRGTVVKVFEGVPAADDLRPLLKPGDVESR